MQLWLDKVKFKLVKNSGNNVAEQMIFIIYKDSTLASQQVAETANK